MYLFLGSDSLDRDVFHVWAYGEKYTAHVHSIWGAWHESPELCSGTMVPATAMDQFVMMRFAELVASGEAADLVAAMLSADIGGSGAWQLKGNGKTLLGAIAQLQGVCRRYTVDDFFPELGARVAHSDSFAIPRESADGRGSVMMPRNIESEIPRPRSSRLSGKRRQAEVR